MAAVVCLLGERGCKGGRKKGGGKRKGEDPLGGCCCR